MYVLSTQRKNAQAEPGPRDCVAHAREDRVRRLLGGQVMSHIAGALRDFPFRAVTARSLQERADLDALKE
jgi:hypothetical protein